MLNKAQILTVVGLAVLFFCGCGDSADKGTKTVTFYVKGMGEKLKLL